MPSPKDHLKQLLELAADPAPETRSVLKSELEALLANWPGEYPDSSRAPFTLLLEKVTRESRHDESGETAIAAALRAEDRDRVIALLAKSANVGDEVVWQALSEESGRELAELCRSAKLSRATYSSLALLLGPARGRAHATALEVLEAFDAPAQHGESIAAE